jgi:hypothetical protein
MLVVGADAVDPQPYTAKDADDDGGDWPIQHLAAVDSKSLAIENVTETDADRAAQHCSLMIGKGHTHRFVCVGITLTSRSTERPILLKADHTLHDQVLYCCQLFGMSEPEQDRGHDNLLGPWCELRPCCSQNGA